MLLGGGRFAIANQKDGQGGWTWRTFGTGTGFTADEINAGKIKAEFVQVGAATTFEVGYDPNSKVETWAYPYEPTPANLPASKWATEEEKTAHIGDIFYDTVTGYSYEYRRLAPYELAARASRIFYNGLNYFKATGTNRLIPIGQAVLPTVSWETNPDWPSRNEIDYTAIPYYWTIDKLTEIGGGYAFWTNTVIDIGGGVESLLFVTSDGTIASRLKEDMEGVMLRQVICVDAPVGKYLKDGDGDNIPHTLSSNEFDWVKISDVSGIQNVLEIANEKLNAPGYVESTAEGIKVFDASDDLRCLLGSWLAGEDRKYGLKIIGGEIFASKFKTGAETDTSRYVEIGETSTYGYICLVGSNGKVLDFDASADQGKVSFYDDGSLRGAMMINGATTKEIWIHGSNGAGINLSGYNGEYITLGSASGATKSGISISALNSTLQPYNTDDVNLGASNRKWWYTYTHFISTGDLNFSETDCAICGGKFKDGDILVLLVKTINEENYTMTIPVHERCKGITKAITLTIPTYEVQHELDTRGDLQPVLVHAFDEVEEDIIRTHPNFDLNPKTGKFRRKLTEENLEIYSPEELENGVPASKRVALVTDTIVKRVPRCREYTTMINGVDDTVI